MNDAVFLSQSSSHSDDLLTCVKASSIRRPMYIYLDLLVLVCTKTSVDKLHYALGRRL